MLEIQKGLRGRQVLVVDDERFSRSIIARFLFEMGLGDVTQAKDGAEALTKLADDGQDIALVICDFNMPVMNGLQFLKALRTGVQRAVRRDLPVIMLTGHSDHGLVGAAMALDVDAFLVKPVSKGNLESRLLHVVSATPEAKDIAVYNHVDVDRISDLLLRGKAPPEPELKAKPAEEAGPRGRKITLLELEPRQVLAEDLVAPSGELLLAAGVALSQRMIQRLRELPSLGIPLEHVWID